MELLLERPVICWCFFALPKASKSSLSRDAILAAFQKMSDELGRRGATGEPCLFGGIVMVLAFAARPSTKDVAAIFSPRKSFARRLRIAGEASGFTPDGLNDAAEGFLSARHETISGNLPQFPHLRLLMPTTEYLTAMKRMAARIGSVDGEADDVSDITFLIRHLKLNNPRAVTDIVAAYYTADRIPVKAQYLVEGFFAEGKI